MSYKIIDGVLYQSVDAQGIQAQLDDLVAKVKPYTEGIAQCEAQIKEYKAQIATIVANSSVDKEAAKILAPEKADFLGF